MENTETYQDYRYHCPVCDGPGEPLGVLGHTEWCRCRDCGMDFRVVNEPKETLVCLDGPDGCSGPVEYRMPLSGTGRSFPRCEYHWAKRLDVQARINHDYPDSPCAPDWFDESYAGERWDEDY